jgi:hypothetical protein
LKKLQTVILSIILFFSVIPIFNPIENVYASPDTATAYATGETFETVQCTTTGEIDGVPDTTYNTCAKGDDVYTTGFNTSALTGATIQQVYANITYYGTVSGVITWYYNSTSAGLTFTSMGDLTEGGSSGSPLTETYNLTSIRGSWSIGDLNNTELQFKNNDAGGSQDAFVDALYLTVVYSPAVFPDQNLTIVIRTGITAVLINGSSVANNSQTAFNISEVANITATGSFNAFLFNITGNHNHTNPYFLVMDNNYTVTVIAFPSSNVPMSGSNNYMVMSLFALGISGVGVGILIFRRKR